MSHHVLEREQWVPCPLEHVFEFFSNARNLEHLTPPWLRFRIVTLPIAIEPGVKIHYRIGWHGLPLKWTTEIETWEPPHRFTDTQLKGPYKLWHHTHTFESVSGGTLLRDTVRYALPMGPFGDIAHALWVKKDVEKIFAYRQARIAKMFGAAHAGKDPHGAGHILLK